MYKWLATFFSGLFGHNAEETPANSGQPTTVECPTESQKPVVEAIEDGKLAKLWAKLQGFELSLDDLRDIMYHVPQLVALVLPQWLVVEERGAILDFACDHSTPEGIREATAQKILENPTQEELSRMICSGMFERIQNGLINTTDKDVLFKLIDRKDFGRSYQETVAEAVLQKYHDFSREELGVLAQYGKTAVYAIAALDKMSVEEMRTLVRNADYSVRKQMAKALFAAPEHTKNDAYLVLKEMGLEEAWTEMDRITPRTLEYLSDGGRQDVRGKALKIFFEGNPSWDVLIEAYKAAYGCRDQIWQEMARQGFDDEHVWFVADVAGDGWKDEISQAAWIVLKKMAKTKDWVKYVCHEMISTYGGDFADEAATIILEAPNLDPDILEAIIDCSNVSKTNLAKAKARFAETKEGILRQIQEEFGDGK